MRTCTPTTVMHCSLNNMPTNASPTEIGSQNNTRKKLRNIPVHVCVYVCMSACMRAFVTDNYHHSMPFIFHLDSLRMQTLYNSNVKE